jgi:HK97 family phage major capsid protein
MTILEMREKRAALIAKAREILNKADSEKRSVTGEENTVYENIMKEVDELKISIDREERLSGIENELSTPKGPSSATKPGTQAGENREGRKFDSPEYRNAMLSYFRRGIGMSHDEMRSLHVGSDPEGGYFVPTTFENVLREKLENANIMRGLVDAMTTDSDRQFPFEEDYGEAFWTGEEKAFQESNASFSLKTIGSHKLSTLVKVSEELLKDSTFNVEGYLQNRFSRRFARKEELSIIKGDGVGKPRGIVTDATVGVTAASQTALTTDELIDLFHSLERFYRGNAKWIMADSTAKVIRKLKNAVTGDYVWQPGLTAGQPDSILTKPVFISDDVDAIAAAKNVILFGDYKQYMLVDRQTTVIQRLNELYAVNGQVGFRAYRRLDGRLMRADSVKMLKMKA